ncbi:MAG: four helix bundle protein [Dysgonamonadaceae bacterium]|jgi:four helix bundle protein|nr:four helix bundle protein [Dysgonamonadaceae bacterium]
MGKKESVLREKSYEFAVRIVKLSQFLQNKKKEFILNKQILRSGTAIGALIREAEFAQSNADFIHKLSISLKEANETAYWLSLLKDTDYVDLNLYKSFSQDCAGLVSMLVSSIKTLKTKTP